MQGVAEVDRLGTTPSERLDTVVASFTKLPGKRQDEVVQGLLQAADNIKAKRQKAKQMRGG